MVIHSCVVLTLATLLVRFLCVTKVSIYTISVLLFSCSQSEDWPHHGRNFFIYLCFLYGSLVHVLMLSIQDVHGLPCLHAPGIVPFNISFSRQLPCFLMVWP